MSVIRINFSAGRRLFLLSLGAALLLLNACGKQTITSEEEPSRPSAADSWDSTTVSESAPDDGSAIRGSRPYIKNGKTYVPLLSAEGFSEGGMASWYGKDFHGKLTANGERYDMHALTAAHKTLPFGSMIRVTNLENNKSIVVRINDRGPFVGDRIIDLTYAGAKQLDFMEVGTALVRLGAEDEATPQAAPTVIKPEPPAVDRQAAGYYVQVGAFAVEDNSAALIRRLRAQGYTARSLRTARLWRVQVGPYTSMDQANSAARTLEREFGHNFIVAY